MPFSGQGGVGQRLAVVQQGHAPVEVLTAGGLCPAQVMAAARMLNLVEGVVELGSPLIGRQEAG